MFWGTYSICCKNAAYENIIVLTDKVMKKIGFFG